MPAPAHSDALSPVATVNGGVSFWFSDMGGIPAPRPSLQGDLTAQVCIVGAGYTGLWTAWYLAQARPDWRIVVLERAFAGFGASGRNGGWLAGTFDWPRERYLRAHSREAIVAMQKVMAASVDAVIDACEQARIDADIRRVDSLSVALNQAQLQRLLANADSLSSWGVPSAQLDWLNASQTRARIDIPSAVGALVLRGMARVQPAKLVRGLAQAVSRLGVPIYEETAATHIAPGEVHTAHGVVRAPVIIRATEAYSASLPGHARSVLPLNSALIVTEPLSDSFWAKVGWQGYELLENAAHAMCFAQRTQDGRIAIGGRGVPYRFGSRTDHFGETQAATIAQLKGLLGRVLPQAAGAPIAHAWCGVLGVARDWCPSCGFDAKTGLGWAGGYAGLGVATSNLAGRTLRDLVLGQSSTLTALPWVNHQVRRWEPEPLRWMGVQATYALLQAADRREAAGLAQTSKLSQWAARLARM